MVWLIWHDSGLLLQRLRELSGHRGCCNRPMLMCLEPLPHPGRGRWACGSRSALIKICWLAKFRNGSAWTVWIVFSHEQVYIWNYHDRVDRRLGINQSTTPEWLRWSCLLPLQYCCAPLLLEPIVDDVGHSIVLNTADQPFSWSPAALGGYWLSLTIHVIRPINCYEVIALKRNLLCTLLSTAYGNNYFIFCTPEGGLSQKQILI